MNSPIPSHAGTSDCHAPSSRLIIQLLIIFVTGVAVYSNSLNGPFHFDDLGISDTSYLWPRAFTSGPRQFVDLTFVANHLLHGQQVLGYHLVNIAVHLAAALTLYGLVHSSLTALAISFPSPAGAQSDEVQFIRRFVPFSTALIFVCHPIQTQAVSYIVQRYASMAALFYLCSMLAFIRARSAALAGRTRWRIGLFSVLSLIAGVIALRCKETSYTLPIMLIVLELFLFRGRLLRNKAFVGCLAALLLAIPLIRIAQQGLGGLEDLAFTIQHATKEELTYSRNDYLLTQFRVVVSYLRLLIAPINLNLDYDVPLQRSLFTLPVFASLMLHLTLFLAALVLFIRSGRLLTDKAGQRGICLRLASLGIVWFYLALSVESSIIPILDVMFEHRLYLPSGGAFLVMTAMTATLVAGDRSLRNRSWAVLAMLCCVLSIGTIQRNRIWNSDLLLWEDTAAKSPNKPRVLANLTAAYLNAGMAAKAVPLLLRTIELSPGFTDSLNNLGTVLDQLNIFEGRYDNGRHFIVGTRTVNMRYYNAWFANTRNNLGLVYEYAGNLEKARQSYEAAVALTPDFDLAWYNLLLVAARLGDRATATAALARLGQLNPVLARSVSLSPGLQH